jgi:hypothetical protein
MRLVLVFSKATCTAAFQMMSQNGIAAHESQIPDFCMLLIESQLTWNMITAQIFNSEPSGLETTNVTSRRPELSLPIVKEWS